MNKAENGVAILSGVTVVTVTLSLPEDTLSLGSNRGNGYSVSPRGYSLSILASDRKVAYPPTPKTFIVFSPQGT